MPRAPQHHYLVRSVDPVDPPLAVPHADYVTGRGPFDEAHDRMLLREHRIEIVVAKNSGGTATYGKIAAARALGLPVILFQRPVLPQVAAVDTVATWSPGSISCAISRLIMGSPTEPPAAYRPGEGGRDARSHASRLSRR